MTAITARIRSSRDHGTRPLFVEKAATSQYNQKAAQPTAKTSSTAPILTHGSTPAAARLRCSRLVGRKHGDDAVEKQRLLRGGHARGLQALVLRAQSCVRQ